MRIFIVILLLFLTPILVQARVGENEQQCNKRYGKPFGKTDRGSFMYDSNGITLEIFYDNSVAQMIVYRMGNKSPMEDDLVDKILLNYSEKWQLEKLDQPDRQWFLQKTLFAHHGRKEKMLVVTSVEYIHKSFVENTTKGL